MEKVAPIKPLTTAEQIAQASTEGHEHGFQMGWDEGFDAGRESGLIKGAYMAGRIAQYDDDTERDDEDEA